MKPKVRTILYGDHAECRAAEELLRSLEDLTDHHHECCYSNDLEAFEAVLVDMEPTLVIVLADGAAGMECVYLARTRRPNLPVFWFSDDHEFGMQSYRLNCAYFSTKPATREKMRNAVHRCAHVGVSIATA